MKSASPPLAALLAANRRLPRADCFQLVTQEGADISSLAAIALGNPVGRTYFLTSFDAHVVVGNALYRADGPQITGVRYRARKGLQVDSQTITISAYADTLLGDTPALQAIATGLLDGAAFRQVRAYFDPAAWPPTPGQPARAIGAIVVFAGLVGEVKEVGRTTATVEIRSDLARLDIDFPRNMFQAGCLNTLYGPGCDLNRKLFQVGGVTSGVSTRSHLAWTNSRPLNYFAQGVVTLTSGVNAGLSRPVASHDPAGLTLAYPLPQVPSVADSFIVAPGCNHVKSDANGCAKFRNQRNFRGFEHIPPPETAI